MDDDRNPKKYRPLRAVTRLLVGGLILGSDALQERLRNWEGQKSSDILEDGEVEYHEPVEFDPLPEALPPPGLERRPQESRSDWRYALLGLVFESEDQLEKGLETTKRVGSFAGKVLNPIIKPFAKIPNPANKPYNRLVQRGESEVDRWVKRGQEESTRSRQLAQDAATNTVDESISYMAQNPALEELIAQQSVGLARQILELVRSNAVSADYFFEGLVRFVLRQKPRYLLSPPSIEVQAQATWTLQDIRHEELNGDE